MDRSLASEGGWRRRPQPSHPYGLPDCRLTVPIRALEMTVGLFAPYARRRVEAACYWYGTRDEAGNGIVRAILVPQQVNGSGNYQISAAAMAAVAERTRPHGWRNLAQIHTHPGTNVEHSWYDDDNASSRRALSLVLPRYGVWNGGWPHGIGVHECQAGYWHLLTAPEAGRRVLFDLGLPDPELVDLR